MRGDFVECKVHPMKVCKLSMLSFDVGGLRERYNASNAAVGCCEGFEARWM